LRLSLGKRCSGAWKGKEFSRRGETLSWREALKKGKRRRSAAGEWGKEKKKKETLFFCVCEKKERAKAITKEKGMKGRGGT